MENHNDLKNQNKYRKHKSVMESKTKIEKQIRKPQLKTKIENQNR